MSRFLSRAFFVVLCCLGLALVTTSLVGAGKVGPSLVSPIPKDWPSFGYDLNSTRFNASERSLNSANVSTLVLAWSAHTGHAIVGSPVMVNGIVYINSVDGNLYAFNATTGATIWSTFTGTAFDGSPGSSLAVANGVVYSPVGNPVGLAAFNATTGAQLWRFASGDRFITSPIVANGIVYSGSTNSNFFAINATTGAQLWQVGSTWCGGSYSVYAPAVVNGVVYLDFLNNVVCALDATTGARLWYTDLVGSAQDEINSSVVIANGMAYVTKGASLYALNPTNGATLWSAPTAGPIFSSPAVAYGMVYVGSTAGNLYAFDATTGAALWNTPAGGIL